MCYEFLSRVNITSTLVFIDANFIIKDNDTKIHYVIAGCEHIRIILEIRNNECPLNKVIYLSFVFSG